MRWEMVSWSHRSMKLHSPMYTFPSKIRPAGGGRAAEAEWFGGSPARRGRSHTPRVPTVGQVLCSGHFIPRLSYFILACTFEDGLSPRRPDGANRLRGVPQTTALVLGTRSSLPTSAVWGSGFVISFPTLTACSGGVSFRDRPRRLTVRWGGAGTGDPKTQGFPPRGLWWS